MVSLISIHDYAKYARLGSLNCEKMNKNSIWQHHEDVLRESAVTMIQTITKKHLIKKISILKT